MFFEDTLFLVPIYRQSKKQYFSELRIDFKKYEDSIAKDINDEELLKYFYDKEKSAKRYERWVNIEGNSFWELNQIIGWIQFYIHGIKIKANLWFVKSKRINKRPKKKIIDYMGKLGDVTDINYCTNVKLRSDILNFINNAQKGLYGFGLEKYSINTDWLLKIINYTDIKSIVESNIKR